LINACRYETAIRNCGKRSAGAAFHLLLIIVALTAGAAGAQYPARPVRLIVPFAPGGATDVIARIVAAKLTDALGQQVITDNRAGGGGNIGYGLAASAAPDGYTVLIMSSSFLVNHALYPKAPYDPNRSFIPITNMAGAPAVIVAHPSVPVKSIPDLVRLAKANPGKFNMATPGVGTLPDLSAALLKLTEKIDIVSVPYSGAAPALGAVLANQVQSAYMALPTVVQHVQSGRLRGLAVTSAKRASSMPEVLTVSEQGLVDHESEIPNGVMVPAGTSAAIVHRLYKEVTGIVAQPDTRERILGLGYTVISSTPEQFTAQIRNEVAKWSKVIRSAGIKAE
jgi:tripartite-type tricarboxylate transporter receptor subunit TctC